ncbi:MAG TPA: tripartite tricarboxylate transporter substrate binding protein [Xanthobacteraceae bacterium]
MKRDHRCLLGRTMAAACILSVGMLGHDAWPQTTPTVKFLVPFGPGSSIDFLARLTAEQIGRSQAQAPIVENRPGAGTIVAADAAARAAPDGSTVLFVNNPFVINPHLRKVAYDPLTSFEPICHLVDLPNVIVVNAGSPYHSLAELLRAARDRPGTLTLASVGPGSASQIAFEVLKRAAGVQMTFVPFQGSPAAVNALLGDHVTSVFTAYADVIEQLNAGKLRALAVASRSRIAPLPDLPTVAESGFDGYEADLWYGVVAPAKTPKEVITRLAGWFAGALAAPDLREKLVAQGIYPAAMCDADFRALIHKQFDEYGNVIREANIKAE